MAEKKRNILNIEFRPVIGLEVHAQLKTKTKAFTSTGYQFNSLPNTQVSPFCIAHPGTLPVINKKLIYYAIRLGLATNCSIERHFHFDRKNYFYPDLPKGYQISQDKKPICTGGYIEIYVEKIKKKIRIRRIHMEEDAGKLIHDHDEHDSLVDINRAGAPLLEIVSEPDLCSSKEAHNYLVHLKQLLQYLDICEASMEKGNFRCDVNISVQPHNATEMGTRTEIKNLNSFRNVEQAIEYEIKRQSTLLSKNQKVRQETRLWNVDKNKTYAMRSKEDLTDYRYFPEPDLPDIYLKEEECVSIYQQMPELPKQKKTRFIQEYGLNDYSSSILTRERDLAAFFEKLISLGALPMSASNCIMKFVMRELNTYKISIHDFPIDVSRLAQLICLQDKKMISSSAMGIIFDAMLNSKEKPYTLMEKLGLQQVSNENIIEQYIQEVIKTFPKEVQSYQNGKTKIIGFLIGKVMQVSKSQANPKIVRQCLEKYLNK